MGSDFDGDDVHVDSSDDDHHDNPDDSDSDDEITTIDSHDMAYGDHCPSRDHCLYASERYDDDEILKRHCAFLHHIIMLRDTSYDQERNAESFIAEARQLQEHPEEMTQVFTEKDRNENYRKRAIASYYLKAGEEFDDLYESIASSNALAKECPELIVDGGACIRMGDYLRYVLRRCFAIATGYYLQAEEYVLGSKTCRLIRDYANSHDGDEDIHIYNAIRLLERAVAQGQQQIREMQKTIDECKVKCEATPMAIQGLLSTYALQQHQQRQFIVLSGDE